MGSKKEIILQRLRFSFESTRSRLLGSLLLNVLIFGGLWVVYSSVRQVTADSFGVARANAARIISFQDSLGLPSEAVFQGWFLDYEWFVRAANVFYIGAHFPMMIGFLFWVLVVKRHGMPRFRWALVVSTIAGLVIHLAFPLAPPRMFRALGFVDTARLIGPDPYALGIAKTANQFAAMPSLHVGWALLIALAVIRLAHSRWRWLILAHPGITSFVVVVTANHYWADVIVGAGLAVVAWWIAGLLRPIKFSDPGFRSAGINRLTTNETLLPDDPKNLVRAKD